MFCTRCGQAVGQTDRVCATCGNDLSRSGAIRLTDPATLGDASSGPPPEWFRDEHKFRQIPESVPTSTPVQTPAPVLQPPTAATWQPPPSQQPVTYPDVDYVPRPEPGLARNSGVMLALIGMVLLALVLVVAVAIRFLRPNNSIVVIPTPTASSSAPKSAKPSTASATEQSGEPTPEASASATASSGLPAGVTECTPTVGAGRNTSCEFALNVAGEVDKVDPATMTSTFQVTAKSPVTGQSYTMSCAPTAGMIVCIGGNSASVYLIKQ